jgi:hypothetical protein
VSKTEERLKLFQICRTHGPAFANLTLCVGLITTACPGAAQAARSAPRAPASQPDVVGDFRALAQQRPWHCKSPQPHDVPATGWSTSQPECAWQNRLRMQTWRGPNGLQGTPCVSAQAYWWNWARGQGGTPAARHPAWRSAWTSQSLRDDSGPEKRIVMLRRLPDGKWSATEWRWTPSPRAATRAWQQRRWNVLAGRAEHWRQQAGAASGTREARMLQNVLEANLGTRPAELGGDVLRWQTDGLCLQVDATAPGPQQLQLPYSADDSRLANCSCIAERYPKATWLSTFSLVPTPRHVRSGAKFYAVWVEGAVLKGQLWIPTKGDGPLVRVRITTDLPARLADPIDTEALARPRQVVEREMMGLAARWAAAYE